MIQPYTILYISTGDTLNYPCLTSLPTYLSQQLSDDQVRMQRKLPQPLLELLSISTELLVRNIA